MKNNQTLKLCAALLSIGINLALFVAIDTGFSAPMVTSSSAPIKL